MLHALSSASAPPMPPFAATDLEVAHARAIITAARGFGLFIAPWLGPKNEPFYLIMDGLESCHDQMMQCPEYRTRRELPKGLVRRLLCDDLGLDPDDPDLCDKVNAIYFERDQVAS